LEETTWWSPLSAEMKKTWPLFSQRRALTQSDWYQPASVKDLSVCWAPEQPPEIELKATESTRPIHDQYGQTRPCPTKPGGGCGTEHSKKDGSGSETQRLRFKTEETGSQEEPTRDAKPRKKRRPPAEKAGVSRATHDSKAANEDQQNTNNVSRRRESMG